MNNLQQLLQTEKSTDELSAWALAFTVTDGRCEYSTPIYALLLDALERSDFTGKLLLFARDVFGMSQYPTFLVQLTPVTKEDEDEVRGPGYDAFRKFRKLVAELCEQDSGMTFLKEYAEIGDSYEPLHNSILRGNALFKNGQAVSLTPADENEQSLFEETLIGKFPGVRQADAMTSTSEP